MKKIGILLIAALVCACTPKVTVTVENHMGIDRSAEMVEIPVGQLARIALADGETYVVSNAEGAVVPSQVTHDGLLIFQSGLGAGESAKFTITAGAPQEFAAKATGWFSPERLDDFVWENDRVAFRIYGTALIAKDGPSNGIDALYKRSDDMVIGQWYKEYFEKKLSYHNDHGTGLDDYKVGRTLGAGAMAPYTGNKIWLNQNFSGHEVLDNGPLRATFRLTYPNIEVDGKTYSEARTISIDAGSQMSKITQEYGLGETTKVVAGFPLHADNMEDKWHSGDSWLMLEEPATPLSSGVYLGIVMPGGINEVIEDKYDILTNGKVTATHKHILAAKAYAPGRPVTYYTGYGWDKWWHQDEDNFQGYLKNFVVRLNNPLTVGIE